MPCGILFDQLHNVERDMETLRRLAVEEDHPAFQTLWKQRGELLGKIGQNSPRVTIQMSHEEVITRLSALGLEYASGSPGYTAEQLEKAIIRLWYDIEEGWYTEGRFTPGGAPVYNQDDAETAVRFIKREETAADIAHAMTKDEYLGE